MTGMVLVWLMCSPAGECVETRHQAYDSRELCETARHNLSIDYPFFAQMHNRPFVVLMCEQPA